MQKDGYIRVGGRKEIRLTTKGLGIAETMARRHRLIERWLTDVLGLDWSRAHDEAHRLEHALSPVVEERLAEKLGMPSTCPHGNPIPGMPAPEAHRPIPLNQAPAGHPFVVERITEEAEADRQLLRFLWESGIRPGSRIVVSEIAPVRGHRVDRPRRAHRDHGALRLEQDLGVRPDGARGPPEAGPRPPARQVPRLTMAVKALYALQNGFLGFERTGLFYGERSPERVSIPVTCYVAGTSDAVILFDTGISPRAVPGLLRQDPLCRFTDEDLLVHRLDSIGLEPKDIDLVVISHLHFDHAGGAAIFDTSELVVQKDEYAYAQYPAAFFASFYYRKNFDLPGYRWRLLDGDAELVPGVTALRSDGHTPGHQSLLVQLPVTGPVILAGDCCYWQRSIDEEIPPGVVWDPTRAMHSIQRLKTLARLTGGRIFPSHDPVFWERAIKAPEAYK